MKFKYFNYCPRVEALKEIQESDHSSMLLIDNGKQPRRQKSNDNVKHEAALQEAWERLGDLSTDSEALQGKKIAAFLKAVSPHTNLKCGKKLNRILLKYSPP